MSGEKQLDIILQNMVPILNNGVYVYCSIPDIALLKGSNAVLVFRETEGITVIIQKQVAEELGLSYSYVASWITLSVHSALDAVGLTAAFAAALAEAGISCNVVAGYYHDHIFVDVKNTVRAMEVLRGMRTKKL